MDFGLTQDQQEIQSTARSLLEARAGFARVREHAEAGTTDADLWRELCELGWPGIAVAEEHGGQGLGLSELILLSEELGRSVAPVPFLPTALAALFVEHAGDAAQQEQWLGALASGEAKGAVAVSVDGAAQLVPGGADADVVVLVEGDTARVAARDELEIEPVAAIDPTRPAAAVRAGTGAGSLLAGDVAAALARADVAIAAELVGVCDRALGMTVEYVKDRKQFGTPVGAYQAVSHRCAQMLLETEMARSSTAFAAWCADADPSRLDEASAAARAAACDAGRSVTASAIQMHGGIGFTWEADVHWLYKRAQVDATWLYDAHWHRARLAAEVSERLAQAGLEPLPAS
jgi:alkylation response protein AidB-like acyl-CoA dehydrogenase